MAKYGRNRGMFFGSWTGQPNDEEAEVSTAGSTGIESATADAAKFGEAVGGMSGEYTFNCVKTETGTKWEMNSNTADVSTTYGITITGTPAAGDVMVVTYTAASGGWEALGKDNDELTKDLNPDTEVSKNVLGETTFTHSGYEATLDLDPYYIDPSRLMYKHLLDIAMREAYDATSCMGYFAEAFFEVANAEKQTMSGYCYVRQAWFVPQSTGGDTSGYAIPVAVAPVGPMTRKAITYDMTTNQATITDL